MKKILAIITLVFLTNCSYKPLINPETSRDKWTGESIAGDYYKANKIMGFSPQD